MKNFDIVEFKKIFDKVITNKDDYADRTRVKKHNLAMTKLNKEIEKLSIDKSLLINFCSTLLKDENDYIKRFVSAECLKYEILQEEAVQILTELLKDDNHKLNAEIILKQYKKL